MISPTLVSTSALRTKHRCLDVPLIAGAIAFLIHLVGNPHYGFHRDELYFVLCGQHPQWGYVDQPPIVPLLSAASQVFGRSLVLLRAVPAFFAGTGVYVTTAFAAELGGGIFAQILSALTVFSTPVLLAFGMKASPDMVGLALWPLIALLVLRLAKGTSPRLWLLVGTLLAISIQSKHSAVFFAVALLIALMLTPERRILFTPWFLAGVALCGLIVLPNFLWQANHGFPQLEVLRNGQQGKNVIYGPIGYVVQQFLITGLVLPIVWLSGLAWLLWHNKLRFLGFAYVTLIGIMIALHGKNYYPANVYPYLIAAGGVAIERWTTARARALRVAMVTFVCVVGITFFPVLMPVLSEQQCVAYGDALARVLHMSRETTTSDHRPHGDLPDDYGGMHGWPELAATVTRVFDSLPPEDRAQAVIRAQNYGEAGAIEFFGTEHGLPTVISGHNEYYLWGPRGQTGDVMICVGGNCDWVARWFDRCETKARFSASWIQPYEDGVPVMVCRGIKKPLAEIWPEWKYYE